ncbi:MAG: Ig-like domain-containing protein, partial [Clostridium sp.]
MNAQKISHRLLSALVAVCLLLTFSLPSAAAQENAPAVTVSSTSGVPGEQVEISMDTENLSPAIGLSIKFSFDSSQISCVDVKLDPGLEAEGKDVILLHSPNTGLITFAFVASDKVPYSFGHLFTATFEIKDGAQTTSITPKVEVYRNQSNEELSSSVKVSSGEITVMDIPVADISLDRHELNMLTGGIDTLVATVSPDNATDKSVSWASSDPGVVSVDQEGNLSALKPGNATITATAANGLSDSCSVTVADPDIPVADISLDRHELNMLT